MNITTKQIITISIAAVVVISLFSMLSALFTARSYDKDAVTQFEAVIAAKDSALAAAQREKEIMITYYDTLISMDRTHATAYIQKAKSNQPNYKKNTQDYEAISVNVRNLTKDSLRRAVLTY